MKNKKRFRNKFKMTFGRGFTLAEVLITLTIIGVIAALTIPNLMQKWQDHADVVKVKEAYSILSNAIKMAISENGSIEEWQSSHIVFGTRVLEKIKTAKICGNRIDCTNYGWDTSGEAVVDGVNCKGIRPKWLSGNVSDWYCMSRGGGLYSAILKNGMVISILAATDGAIEQSGRMVYGEIVVDINGRQKPNRFGYDVFVFDIGANQLYPVKYKSSWYRCMKPNDDGRNCSTWVLKHGNMDYKYRDVSAEW